MILLDFSTPLRSARNDGSFFYTSLDLFAQWLPPERIYWKRHYLLVAVVIYLSLISGAVIVTLHPWPGLESISRRPPSSSNRVAIPR
jgi:hypothetical protein